jgi:hypothetical protein
MPSGGFTETAALVHVDKDMTVEVVESLLESLKT